RIFSRTECLIEFATKPFLIVWQSPGLGRGTRNPNHPEFLLASLSLPRKSPDAEPRVPVALVNIFRKHQSCRCAVMASIQPVVELAECEILEQPVVARVSFRCDGG